jgi:RimJ/RimL family protein N-acetyltransferase
MKLVAAIDAHFAWLLDEAAAPVGLSRPDDGPIEPPMVLRWLRRQVAARTDAGVWLMVEAGEVVGLCSHKTPPGSQGTVEIGYGVARTRRRRGHATAAVAELVRMASADARVNALTAETAAANLESQGALIRNGFLRVDERADPGDGLMLLWRRPLADG